MNSRLLGIALAVVSSGLLLVSVLGNHWLRAEYDTGTVGLGLRSAQVCGDDDQCVTARVAECRSVAKEIGRAGDQTDYMAALFNAPDHCAALIAGSFIASVSRASRLSENRQQFQRRLEKMPKIELGSFLFFAQATFVLGFVVSTLLLLCAGLVAARRFVHWPIAPTTLALFSVILIFITGPVTVALNPFVGLGVDWGFWLFGAGATGGLIAGIVLGRQRPPDDPYWDDGDDFADMSDLDRELDGEPAS